MANHFKNTLARVTILLNGKHDIHMIWWYTCVACLAHMYVFLNRGIYFQRNRNTYTHHCSILNFIVSDIMHIKQNICIIPEYFDFDARFLTGWAVKRI